MSTNIILPGLPGGMDLNPSAGGSSGPVSPGNGPFFDTFSGGVSPLSAGRTGWTVQGTSTQSGNLTTFTVSGGNLIRGVSTNQIHAFHDTGAGAGESWGVWKGASAGQASDSLESHITVDPTNNNTSMLFGGSGTTLNQRYDINGTHTGQQSFTFDMKADDVYEHLTIDVSGTKYLRGILNGRWVIVNTATATSFGIQASLGRAPNGTYGIKANTSTPAMREFAAGNQATDAKITVYSAGRVRHPTNPWKLAGTYFSPRGAAPTDAGSAVKVYMYNTSDDSIVPGYNGLTVSNLIASGGTWTAQIPNPGIDNVWFRVQWEFKDPSGNAAFAPYPSANQYSGYKIVVEGQSQVGFMEQGPVTTVTPTYTTNKIVLNAPTPQKTVATQISTNSNYGLMANAVQGYTPKPITIGNFSVGGTTYPQRSPGGSTGMFPCAAEALTAFFNNAPDMIVFSGGTSDISSSPTIYNDIITMANAMEDAMGLTRGTGVFGICPEGNIIQGNDANVDLTRREMWRLTRDEPYGRFKLVGWRNDMQHQSYLTSTTQADDLHYARTDTSLPSGYTSGVTVGTPEHCRRIILGAWLALGLTTDDFRGPKPLVFRRVDANTMAWKFAMLSFPTVDLINSTYSVPWQHTGGMRFSASSSFGTLIYPDGHAVQTPAGDGTIEIFFTLSSGWPATVYSSGPYGADPFNPGGLDTGPIALDMGNNASKIVGIKSGMASVAVQPTYGIGGTNIDYLSA